MSHKGARDPRLDQFLQAVPDVTDRSRPFGGRDRRPVGLHHVGAGDLPTVPLADPQQRQESGFDRKPRLFFAEVARVTAA